MSTAPDRAAAQALAQGVLRLAAGHEGSIVTETLVAQGYARHGAADLRRRYQAGRGAIDAYLAGIDLSRVVADVYGDARTLRAAQARAAAGTNPVPVAGLALAAGAVLALLLASK